MHIKHHVTYRCSWEVLSVPKLFYPVAGASLAGAEVPPPLTECIFYRLYYKFQLHYTLITFASFDRLGPYHQNKCSVSMIFSDFQNTKGDETRCHIVALQYHTIVFRKVAIFSALTHEI